MELVWERRVERFPLESVVKVWHNDVVDEPLLSELEVIAHTWDEDELVLRV